MVLRLNILMKSLNKYFVRLRSLEGVRKIILQKGHIYKFHHSENPGFSICVRLNKT